MRVRTAALLLVGLALVAGGVAYRDRLLPLVAKPAATSTASADPVKPPQGISVTVARAGIGEFVETALVTGTLVAREEILVGPEVEGLRVTEVLAEEGDRVKKGQVLARLVSDTLEAQIAQNDAAQARADAAIAQSRSNIASAEARLEEARNAYERGRPLSKSGVISESTMDQREAAARTAQAALTAARDGLKLAQAEKAQIAAQRRELDWRRSRTEVTAPADGVISRRVARIGAYAVGAQDAMFRIVAKGEVELDAEVPETVMTRIRTGQTATVNVAGLGDVPGTVRLVSQEIDRVTRLGRVRISLGNDAALRVGAFGRGVLETARARGV
ncbi:MAG TPA: efflux RND transporter periplasmic adaptor subunit, partial [Hyphomicrobiaceae bacterium]|nr:efflux RND transporter periplasmic adaptor subunit [Hyphomicrobiaceae bacterium]